MDHTITNGPGRSENIFKSYTVPPSGRRVGREERGSKMDMKETSWQKTTGLSLPGLHRKDIACASKVQDTESGGWYTHKVRQSSGWN